MTRTEEARTPGQIPSAEPITILYENWRGETALRHIIVGGEDDDRSALWFGLNEWHRVPQYLLSAWDVEKGAYRDFALSGIKAWGQAAVDAALAAAPSSPGVPDSVRARLQQAIDDFESEHADAHGVGERPDLWDEVVEVPISDVREVVKAIPTLPSGQSAERRPLRLAVTEEWLRREGEADAVAECEAGATASPNTRGADATVPPHIIVMARAMADGRAPAWEKMRYGSCVPQQHSRSYWVVLAQDAEAALDTHPAGQSVPDSVRALSEAATKGEWLFERAGTFCGLYSNDAIGSVIGRFAGLTCAPKPAAEQDANAALAAFAVNRLREEIATHPAGQSTGQGADDGPIDDVDAWSRHWSARRKPAPDSTRTGAVGTAAEAFLERHQGWMTKAEWSAAKQDLVALLAARPAAPEAQGVWSEDTDDEKSNALRNCAEAVAFFDQVKASSSAEQAAVGTDHWNWLEAACRRAGKVAPPSSSGQESAQGADASQIAAGIVEDPCDCLMGDCKKRRWRCAEDVKQALRKSPPAQQKG